MDRHRFDEAHLLTPREYRCPACGVSSRMAIEWPFWRCSQCNERLIPADLHPRSADASTVTIGPAPGATAAVPEGPIITGDAPSSS